MNTQALAAAVLLVSATQASIAGEEPSSFCETTSAGIPIPSYGHCKPGDGIEVDPREVKTICRLSEPVVPVGSKFLCTFRGQPRPIRARPLTEVEKSYQRQQTEALLKKYSN